jgi:hypothetical protein
LLRTIRFLGTAAAVAFSVASTAPSAFAHGGGLDASGCHTNHKTGEYHCHRPQQQPTASSNVVKKSNSGICHDSSSQWYSQTIHYTAFGSLQECLNSGGRLPKG